MSFQLAPAVRQFHHRILLATTTLLCVINIISVSLVEAIAGRSVALPLVDIALMIAAAGAQYWIYGHELFAASDHRTFAQIPRPALYLGTHHFESFRPVNIRKYLFRADTLMKIAVVITLGVLICMGLERRNFPSLVVGVTLAASFSRSHFYVPLLVSCLILLARSMHALPTHSLLHVAVVAIVATEFIAFSTIFRRLWVDFLGSAQKLPTKNAVMTLSVISLAVLIGFLVFRPDTPRSSSRSYSKHSLPKMKFAINNPPIMPPAGLGSGSGGTQNAASNGGHGRPGNSGIIGIEPPPALGSGGEQPGNDGGQKKKQSPQGGDQREEYILEIPWWVVPLLIGMGWILLRWLYRRFKTRAVTDDDNTADDPSRAAIKKAQRQFDSFMRHQQRKIVTDADRLEQVLHLYNALLEHREKCGMGKPLPTTPDEYLLMASSPDPRQNLAMRHVTSTFVRAKYRNTPPTSADFDGYIQAIRFLGAA